MATFALGGCVYTPSTTVRMRDPSAVQVDIVDEQEHPTTLLPAAATPSEVKLPDGSPPYDPGMRPEIELHRSAGGAVDVHCKDCSPHIRPLLANDGTIAFRKNLYATKLDWTRDQMRIDFRDRRASAFGSSFSYQASIATPWSNVVEVRRVSTPSRATGLKLLLSAAVCGALGGFALQNGLSDHNNTTKVFGFVLLPLALVFAGGGAWYALAPSREVVLYDSEKSAAGGR